MCAVLFHDIRSLGGVSVCAGHKQNETSQQNNLLARCVQDEIDGVLIGGLLVLYNAGQHKQVLDVQRALNASQQQPA
jgi:hypothetical protein